MHTVVVLAAGQPHRAQPVAQAAQVVVIVPGQRLLEPLDIEPFQLERNFKRGAKAPLAVAFESWCEPSLVRVDENRNPLPQCFADSLDDAYVIARVFRVEAELDRFESLLQNSATVVDALLGRPHLAGRAVSRDAIRKSPPHGRNGQPRRLAGDVP